VDAMNDFSKDPVAISGDRIPISAPLNPPPPFRPKASNTIAQGLPCLPRVWSWGACRRATPWVIGIPQQFNFVCCSEALKGRDKIHSFLCPYRAEC